MASNSALRAYAKSVVAAELRSYDHLSTPARIVYEHAAQQYVPSLIERGIYKCAHEVMLYEPCTKCGRTSEDCVAYAIAAQSKIKSLLAILNSEVK